MVKTIKLLSANCGKITPDSVTEYINEGGYKGLKKALSMDRASIIGEVKKSSILGRGGAAYPAGEKWQQLLEIHEEPKYIVCNADEGEPGTFKDKVLLEQDPLKVIEGMTIAGYVFNSRDGYIYIRGEYPNAQEIMKSAIANAAKAGYLGDNILGSGYSFNIHVVSGAGAYVCGENSALLNSIEGKAGRPRIKPPHLAEVGLFSMPTLVNNVETLASIPFIIENGGDEYKKYGTENSSGTKLICLSGNIVNKGVYEVPFGVTLRELIFDLGGGIPEGRKFKFVHIGGQSGSCIPEELLDTQLCYKALREKGFSLGTGALVVVDDSTCVIDYVKCVSEFFIHESCGKCTPCRLGNKEVYKILCKFSDGTASEKDLEAIRRISGLMKIGSSCGLGETATAALDTCIKYFKDEFIEHMNKKCRAGVCTFEGGK